MQVKSKRVKVLVPVILQVFIHDNGDEEFELEMDNISEEISIIESDAINAYQSDDFTELSNEEG